MRYKIFRRGGYGLNSVGETGGEVGGSVFLIQDPEGELEASTKAYADEVSLNIQTSSFTSGSIRAERLPQFTGDLNRDTNSNVVNLSPNGVGVGTHSKVSVSNKGLVVAGGVLVEEDIPALPWSKISSGKPTTLSGYGIMSALTTSGGAMVGPLKITTVPDGDNVLVNKQFIDNPANYSTLASGFVVYKTVNTAMSGWLRANGSAVNKVDYPHLYEVIGDTHTPITHRGAGRPWVQQSDFNSLAASTLGSFSALTLPVAAHSASSAITNNQVYFLGGMTTSTTPISTVRTTTVNTSTGAIGNWTVGPALPLGLSGHTTFVLNNRLYVLGGLSGTNALVVNSTLYSAPITADGTLGAWINEGKNLPIPLAYTSIAITRNRIYVFGGTTTDNVKVSNVYTMSISETGVLGNWVSSGNLPGPLSHSQIAVVKNRIHLLGGLNNVSAISPTNVVYSTTVNLDGTINTWSTSTPLPVNLYASQVLVSENFVTLLGGANSAEIRDTYTAQVNADGTLGTWLTNTQLPNTLSYSTAVITGGRFYLMGGMRAGAPVSNNYHAAYAGGLNSYSGYYDGTVKLLVPPSKFVLPNIPNISSDIFAFVKA